MKRIAAFLAVSALFLSGQTRISAGGKTPEETFAKMTEAAKAEDMKGIMVHLTKDSGNILSGSLVGALIFMKQAAPDLKIDVGPLDEVLKQHNINEAKAMEKLKASLGGAEKDPKAIVEAMSSLAADIKDQAGFVGQAAVVLKKLDKFGTQKGPFDELKKAKLKDVNISGDKATAKVETAAKTNDIDFIREGGIWKVDLVPLFMREMKGKGK